MTDLVERSEYRISIFIEKLAKKIAKNLMRMNTGEKAKRLQLMDANENPLGGHCKQSVVEIIEKHIQQARAQLRAAEWISVEDRLPDEQMVVDISMITVVGFRLVSTGILKKGIWYTENNDYYTDETGQIYAWRERPAPAPLPSPPEE